MTSPGDLAVTVHDDPPADWGDLLALDPLSEYSHTPAWFAAAAAHLGGVCPRYWAVRRGGELVGGLVAAMRSLEGFPARGRQESSLEGTSGGPLVSGALDEPARDLVFDRLTAAYADNLRGGLDTCALVLGPGAEARFGARLAGWIRTDAPTAAVDLTGGFATVERDRIGKNKRNERNRGLRRGLEVRITRDPDLLAAYHPLHESAAKVWGIEPTPLAFLQAVLADPGRDTFLSCALLEGRVVGGHLCLHRGERVLAWHGVTDPAVSRSHFPATVLVCADLEEACRRGARWLDLGGSGDQGSLAGFKKFFGAELQMRGLYRRETAGMRVLRAGRDAWGRIRGGGGRSRWHDADGGGSSA